MDLKVLAMIFTTVLIAELGDKTQLATLLFASNPQTSKLAVFTGAAAALIVASGLGVLAGTFVSNYVSEGALRYTAGIGFVAIGVWTLVKA